MGLKLSVILLLTIRLSGFSKDTGPGLVCFETDSLLIRSDTMAFFSLVDKTYSKEHATLIKTEVRYRLSVSKNNEAHMDGMSLSCCLDKARRSYQASCLNYDEALSLLNTGHAKVYYKSSQAEAVSFKTKRRGSKLTGQVERLYIDRHTHQVFLRDSLYHHKWWKRNRGCVLPSYNKSGN